MDVIFAFLTSIIVLAIWIAAGYRGLYNGGGGGYNNAWQRTPSYDNKFVPNSQRQANRRAAIQKAGPFLKNMPKDIMGNLCIANENCKVDLVTSKSGEKKIICINKHLNKEHKREMFTATVNPEFVQYYTQPVDYVVDNIFDTLCSNFGYATVYENIISAASTGMLVINETLLEIPKQKGSIVTPRANQLNLNKATEAELLALPGVNVIIAKKAIKYIEKNGGFNSVDEFIKKMNIKENFAEQIKNIVYAGGQENSYSKDTGIENNHGKNKQDDLKTQKGNLDLIDYNKDTKSSDNNGNERIIDL